MALFLLIAYIVILILQIILLVITIRKKTGEEGKCPVPEYFHKPLIGLSIFFLKTHHNSLWLILHGNNQGNHFHAVCTPTGFHAHFTKINVVKREEVVPMLIAVSTSFS